MLRGECAPPRVRTKAYGNKFFRVASYYFLHGFIKHLNYRKAELSSLLLLLFFMFFLFWYHSQQLLHCNFIVHQEFSPCKSCAERKFQQKNQPTGRNERKNMRSKKNHLHMFSQILNHSRYDFNFAGPSSMWDAYHMLTSPP